MEFKIGDYNTEKIVHIDDDDIENILFIAVHTISGDELVDVLYTDRCDTFDSSDDRNIFTAVYEGTSYVVGKEEIKEFFKERHVEE